MSKLNGVPTAPPDLRGAVHVSPPLPPSARTEFLPDLPARSWQEWLYELSRQRLMALPLARWLIGAMLGMALVWGMARWPGGWWVALAWLAAALLCALLIGLAARNQYVSFHRQPLQLPAAAQMAPDAKSPLYATGWLNVQGRARVFANLPGFYRTFPTREHALLCQLRPRRLFGFGALPDDEPGLWYAFFVPAQITRVDAGLLVAGGQQMSALAITYTAPATKQHRQRNTTLYLAFPSPADRMTVLADLLADQTVRSRVRP